MEVTMPFPLVPANNLSDLPSKSTSRTNLLPAQSAGFNLASNGSDVAFQMGMDNANWFSHEDDFISGGSSKNGLILTTANSGTIQSTSEANHPGISQLLTASSSNAQACWQSTTASITFGGGAMYIDSWVKTDSALSDGTDTYTLWSGFNDSTTGSGTDGAYFRYTHTENSGKWVCVTRSNTTETTADSGITVAVSTWYKLSVQVNADATSVAFYINGALVATITTNIPSGTSRQTGAMPLSIIKSAGTNQRLAGIDLYKCYGVFTTAR